MKKKITLLVSLFLFSACSNLNQVENVQNDFKIKSTDPLPSASDSPLLDPSKLPLPDNANPINTINETRKEDKKFNFDVLPPEGIETVDGEITVIYRNNAKVRLNKIDKNISSLNGINLSDMTNILQKNGLVGSSDLSNDKLSDDEMDKMQSDFQTKNNVDIPHLKSIHYYQLAKGTDTKSLCKELMKLSYVRLAYPTPKAKPTMTSTTIGVTQNNETTTNPFSDPSLSGSNLDHYWFNEHQAFKAWNYFYGYLPKIAVIDSGFDKNSLEVNYSSGYSITTSGGLIYITSGPVDCPYNSCIQETTGTFSHGSFVSSVAAGKKNNGFGGAGIIPDSTILPIKMDGVASSIATGIQVAYNDTSVTAINISYAFSNPITHEEWPLYYDSTINSSISYAVYNKNKPVAIAAGNSESAIANNTYTDAVVVGGTMPVSTTSDTGQFIGWIDPDPNSIYGSNYYAVGSTNSNPIDIAAASYGVGGWQYNPSNNSSSYVKKNGTSLATPMVTATLGMMKNINSTLTARKLKDILIYSSTLRKYSNSNITPLRVLGRDLQYSSKNYGMLAGIRDLNVYNSLVIANNIGNFSLITRSFNIDDYVTGANASASNIYSPYYSIDTYGTDLIYGLNSVPSGSYINFREYNSSGGCAYGYQVYRNNYNDFANWFDQFGGVKGVIGTSSGCNSGNWNYPMSYIYN